MGHLGSGLRGPPRPASQDAALVHPPYSSEASAPCHRPFHDVPPTSACSQGSGLLPRHLGPGLSRLRWFQMLLPGDVTISSSVVKSFPSSGSSLLLHLQRRGSWVGQQETWTRGQEAGLECQPSHRLSVGTWRIHSPSWEAWTRRPLKLFLQSPHL